MSNGSLANRSCARDRSRVAFITKCARMHLDRETAFLIKTILRATEPYNKSRLNLVIVRKSYTTLL